MANQILAGAVVSASAVIAGVDADNPPVTTSGSSGSGDQYWDNVTLLLREDPNSNDVIDVSSFGTEVSEYDSLVWDSSKPGDAWGDSLYANSAQQDQRVWNNSFGSGVQFGTEDYTIDFWVKTNHLDMIRLFDQNTTNNGGFVFRLSWGKIHYGENSGVNNTSYHQHHHGTTVLSDGEWHYIAIARESGVTRIWADGSLEVEFASSMNFQSEAFSLNAGITSTAPRWVNDFRITKGVARYTGSGSIDVPTSPHPTSSGSESSTALTPYEGPDPIHITGDFGIEPNTAFTFEIQFTAPMDNVYRNIFTLGGSPDKKYGAFSLYSNNSTAGRISGGSSVSGTTTDGEYGFFAYGRSAGWIDTEGAQPRLTLIRNANNVTHLFRDGVSIYSSSVSKWPTEAFSNADLTLFAYGDDSVIMSDGSGVTVHGWRFEKSNSYSDQVGDSVIGQGVEIDLLPLDNSA